MAWVFVRLKLRLLKNSGRTTGEKGFLQLARAGALLLALLYAAALAHAPESGQGAPLIATHAAVVVAWILFPLLRGIDTTLDVSRLALLPLSRTRLVLGQLGAAFVGVGPIVTVIVLVGATMGAGGGGAKWIVAALAIPLTLLLGVVASQTALAALGAAVRSRRGRDLAGVLFTLMSVSGWIAWQLAGRAAEEVQSLRPTPITDVLGVLPLAAAGRATEEAARGHAVLALLLLLDAAAGIVAVAWLWTRAVDRALTGVVDSTVRAPHGRGERGLRPALLRRVLPAGAVGAIVAKDLRYDWRAPVQRANILAGIVAGGFFGLPLLAHGARHGGTLLPYVGAPAAFFLGGNLGQNRFGLEGRAFAAHVLAGVPARRLVTAKVIGVLLVLAPIVLAVATAGAAVASAWSELPAALLTGLAVALIVVGMGAVQSVEIPYAVDLTAGYGRTRPKAGRGRGELAFVLFVALAGLVAVVAVAVIASKRVLEIGALPGAAAAFAFALGVFALTLGEATTRLAGREPEVLERLSA